MARPAPMRIPYGWDPQLGRMLGVSAGGHALILFLALVVFPLIQPAPLPIVAYTVELTDPSALGGRLAPGRPDLPMGPRGGPSSSAPGAARLGEPVAKPEPVPPPPPKAEPVPEPEPPKPVERAKAEPPAPVEPAVKLPSPEKPPAPKPEAKKPEPKPTPAPEAKKPEPKPEAKPEAKKAEAKPAEPAKPDAKKADATAKPDAKPTTDAAAKPVTAKAPADATKPAGKPTGKPDGDDDGGGDSYAASAAKWRAKAATGGGGGLGGTDTADGPMGTPGYGAGGGQVVGFEFLAYQQRVVSTVKGVWTNAMNRPGLVAKVRFSISASGEVSAIRIERPSGDAAFDGSTLRAVERANPLPPPPAKYVNEFRDFMIEFHSEDEGGRAAG